jgi:hypothetical protein
MKNDGDSVAPTGSQSAKKGRRRARKRPSVEYVTHVIRVKAWDFYYSRHATDPKSKWERGPISELATLSLVGEVVGPENCKYKDGKLTFSGRADYLDPQPGPSLVPIGSATARGEAIEGYVFVPDERLKLLLTAAQSGQIEVAHFTGPKLRYGSGVIHSVSLDTRFDEDEW